MTEMPKTALAKTALPETAPAPPTPPTPARVPAASLPGTAGLLADQVRYQLRLMLRTPRGLILSLVMPVLLLVLTSSRRGSLSAGAEAAVVGGLAVFGLISTAYVTHALTLVTSRQEGVLRRWRATPLPTWCFFAGKIASTAMIALASVAIALVAGVALYHVHLTAGMGLSLLITFILGAVAWAAVGTAATALIPTPQSAGPVLMLTYLPVVLFSGGLGSVSSEPAWLATAARYLPAQPIVDTATRVLRHAGGGLVLPSGREFAVLAAWLAAGAIAAVICFRWDPVRPRHAARS